MVKIVRLYSGASIKLFQPITLPVTSSHYLYNVMRRKKGDKVIIFDGKSGEFESEIKLASRSKIILEPKRKLAEISMPEDIWVAFTPIKKVRTDFAIEKCTEIGVRQIFPLISDHSTNRNPRIEKWKLNSIEAVEQCGGNFLPEIHMICTLENFLVNLPKDRKLIFCDEVAAEPLIGEALAKQIFGKACLLIGPEGGFSKTERKILLSRNNVFPVSLGSRILRTETAVTFALAAWHANYSI